MLKVALAVVLAVGAPASAAFRAGRASLPARGLGSSPFLLQAVNVPGSVYRQPTMAPAWQVLLRGLSPAVFNRHGQHDAAVFLGSSFVGDIGLFIMMAAQPWILMLNPDGVRWLALDATTFALASAFGFLTLSPIVDAVDSRWFRALTLSQGAIPLAIAAMLHSGPVAPQTLVLLSAANGLLSSMGGGFFNRVNNVIRQKPGMSSQKLDGWAQLKYALGRLAGPLLAVYLVKQFGLETAFWVSSVCYGLYAAGLLHVKAFYAGGKFATMGQALVHWHRSPPLMWTVILSSVSLLGMPIFSLLAAQAKHSMGSFGLMQVSFYLGAVLMSLTAILLNPQVLRTWSERAPWLSLFAISASLLTFSYFPQSDIRFLLLTIAGAAMEWPKLVIRHVVGRVEHNALVARLMGIFYIGNYLAVAGSSAVAGAVATDYDVPTALFFSGLVILILTIPIGNKFGEPIALRFSRLAA